MKKIQMVIFAMVAMLSCFTLPACGAWERSGGDKKLYERCDGENDCESDLFCNMRTDEQGQICLPAFCEDYQKSGDETATDCGGTCNEAYRCSNGLSCSVNKDCVSGRCSGGSCVGLSNGEACDKGPMCASQVCTNGVCVGGGTNACLTNNDCSSGSKVCFAGSPNYCGDCANNAQCGTGFVCSSGTCISGGGGATQDRLCATPSATVQMFCWNQSIEGTVDNGAGKGETVTSGTTVCCPVSSGSFTVPNGTAGTYTGHNHSTVVMPFATWTSRSNTVTGGYF